MTAHVVMTESCNLIVNYLPPDVDEQELASIFREHGTVKSTKIIRHKLTGLSLCYGFVIMASEQMAEAAILALSQKNLRGKVIRVSKARPQEEHQREEDNTNIYIVGIPCDVNDSALYHTFGKYGSIVSTHIIRNKTEGQKGVAFVKFMNHEDTARAVKEHNNQPLCVSECPEGECVCTDTVTVKFAFRKKAATAENHAAFPPVIPELNMFGSATGLSVSLPSVVPQPSTLPNYGYATGHLQTFITPTTMNSFFNPAAYSQMMAAAYRYPYMYENSTVPSYYPPIPYPIVPSEALNPASLALGKHCVFVYGFSQATTEEEVQALFLQYGAVSNIKLAYDVTEGKRSCKGYGFVNFYSYDDAQNAITALNNHSYKGRLLQVRLKSSKDTTST